MVDLYWRFCLALFLASTLLVGCGNKSQNPDAGGSDSDASDVGDTDDGGVGDGDSGAGDVGDTDDGGVGDGDSGSGDVGDTDDGGVDDGDSGSGDVGDTDDGGVGDGDSGSGDLGPSLLDVLIIMDNSRSMVAEQQAIAESFSQFAAILEENLGAGRYRIAIVTTGVESDGCPPCPPDNPIIYSCINETGESGRFQDRLGHNVGTADEPEFSFESEPSCRVIHSDNLDCFYNPAEQRGVILTGINGCGYEKGLAPLRAALSEPLLSTWNANFLHDGATLAVVVVSDEEDCGEVGDVNESIPGISGKVCYYASMGIGPDGSYTDPQGSLYDLTPVREYRDFLISLKGGQQDLVKFAAIVGVEDVQNPAATAIQYVDNTYNSDVEPACSTPDCTGYYCDAMPGTRYIALAELFGIGVNGFVDTICQNDFSDTLTRLATFLTAD